MCVCVSQNAQECDFKDRGGHYEFRDLFRNSALGCVVGTGCVKAS